MMLMPFQILGMWFRGLFSIALWVLAGWLLYQWNEHRVEYVEVPVEVRTGVDSERQPGATETRAVYWEFGFNRETAFLLGGLGLLLFSFGGSWIHPRLFLRRERPETAPRAERTGTMHRLRRPDGSEIQAEVYGPANGPPVILTHGWGLDSEEWYYAKKEFGDHYRLIAWDLPGLGKSTRPADNDWSLEKLAGDLGAVLDLAGGRPAVLVGHSIGGMIALTFCRLFPRAMGNQVGGLVLVHSTYTNPAKTAALAPIYTALQKPVLEPLCHLGVWLAPLVWLMNWVSYLNGSAHRSTARTSFAGNETKEQLDFLSRYYVRVWPGVIARGMLAMFRYDATAVLPTITVPTLVVAGDRDTLCSPEASEHMARTIPGATLATLRPARHCGHFERYEEFGALLKEFLASHTVASPASASAVPTSARVTV